MQVRSATPPARSTHPATWVARCSCPDEASRDASDESARYFSSGQAGGRGVGPGRGWGPARLQRTAGGVVCSAARAPRRPAATIGCCARDARTWRPAVLFWCQPGASSGALGFPSALFPCSSREQYQPLCVIFLANSVRVCPRTCLSIFVFCLVFRLIAL